MPVPLSMLSGNEEPFEKPLPERLDEAYRERDLFLRYADTAADNCFRIVGLLNVLVVDYAHLMREKMPFLEDAADGYP